MTVYSHLKSQSGNQTPGYDKTTLDVMDLKKIDSLQESLKSEKFRFTPIKLIFIPKKNGKMGPQGIPNIKDKLVQEVMRMALEFIFEPKMSNSSHGFRPHRSTHSSLLEISKWNGISWAIEGDIKGFYENLNHQKLMEIMEKHIQDQQFIDLMWKLLKAGYMDSHNFHRSPMGLPQGGIVSPILTNIYLDEFDSFMKTIIEQFSSKEKLISKVNPIMAKFSTKLGKLNEEYQKNKDKSILTEIRKLRAERNQIPSRIRTGMRVYYTRYADD